MASAWLVLGCGATGLDWVDEPESASGFSEPERTSLANVPMPRSARGAPITATADASAGDENHQRLNRTITLGEVDATPAAGPDPGAPYGPPPVSITINNYTQGSAPGYGYGGYAIFGSARGRSGFVRNAPVTGASRSSASGSNMQPGQNWPAVADHGTSFPYRSAPASPWSGGGSRAQ